VARHPIATGDLDQVTVGEGFTLHSAQQQKAVDQALGATRGYRAANSLSDWSRAMQIRRMASGLDRIFSNIGLNLQPSDNQGSLQSAALGLGLREHNYDNQQQ
jgi:hypothetical protein